MPESDAADPFAAAGRLEGVPSAMAAARDGIDALLRDRGLRRTGPDVTAESLLRGAAASAALEGGRYDVSALRIGQGDALAQAAVRLSTQLLALVPVWQRTPPQALARMHALLAGAFPADVRLGQPRDDPPALGRLLALGNRLTEPTDAPALVVAALTHAEIAVVRPFEHGNGLVARAAERLVLASRGVDPASVTVPEAGHLRLAESYRSALDAYDRGAPDGLRRWLMHAATAYAAGAEESPLRR